mmetsp:Transcript_50064/g.140381  ORF Transcript_50064/g.140381 Transcript_50064/m.140381 type:complete len:374 (-) Transcript_50064:171-1292(-)
MSAPFVGFLLVAFVGAKSSLSLLLEASNVGGRGYPFALQTVNVCAFLMQVVFYFCQAARELGPIGAIHCVFSSYKKMGPAMFYSSLVAMSTLLQGLSQNYIDASVYIVLMQLTLVLVALGDRFVMKKPSAPILWCMVFMQTGIVACYTGAAELRRRELAGLHVKRTEANHILPGGAFPTMQPVVPDGELPTRQVESATSQVVGIVLCVLAEICSAGGAILQQRFLQVSSQDLLTCVKLWWQHVFGLCVLMGSSLAQPATLQLIWEGGFFAGWSALTIATAVCMWLYFLVASTVTAHVSALAGAMSSAIVVLCIAVYKAILTGEEGSLLQRALMLALVLNTCAYVHIKERHYQRHIKESSMPLVPVAAPDHKQV